MIVFTLKQVTKNTWVIISPKNKPIMQPHYFDNQKEAENFCRAHLSSWSCATFVIELLPMNKN